MTTSPIYLDYQASTPIDPRVSELVTSVSVASFANPHAEDHAAGWSARSFVEQARSRIATAIGAADDEVVFTSGATEADNLGVLGAALGAPPHRRRILISAFEHKAVLECARASEALGFSVDMIPILPTGLVDLDRLGELLAEDVAVVSVMAVNNEIGTIQPIAEVVALAEPFGAFVHTDATQAPLAMDLDMVDWGVDAASFSSHKLYGPKGVGALYLSSTAPWRPRPLMFGGGQEAGLRPGTLPTPLCAGFGLAMTLLSESERIRVGSLRDRLARELTDRLPGLQITSEVAPRHPGCLHLRLPGRDAKDWVTRLQPTVQIAAGSACTSGVMHGSHVLMSLGWSADQAQEGLRISLGRFTSVEEVLSAAEIIAGTV
jgi:cysteine desulfurase